jgi:hypothetical protein
MHWPPAQLPPVQAEPSGFRGWVQAPVPPSQLPARWHSSCAPGQLTAEVGEPHVPATQVSPRVQALPSSQAAPSATGCEAEQVPLDRSQVRARWHWSRAGQSASLEQAQLLAAGVQRPARQASPVVQARPSSQGAPSSAGGSEQRPLAGSQVPATRHGPAGVQVTGLAPRQAPDWQASAWVHASASSQAVPSALAG